MGDKEALVAAFNSEVAGRVTDALEVKKVEIASTILNTEEPTNEVETTEVEVDGSTDAVDTESAEG
jgi:hypothetical protein